MHFKALSFFLAYADSRDTSVLNQQLVVAAAIVIAVIGGIAFIPLAISWRRRHRNSEAIAAAAVLWGAIAAAMVIRCISAEMKWSQERNMRMMSGYFDAQENADAPAPPVGMGIVLTLSYAGIVGAASWHRRDID